MTQTAPTPQAPVHEIEIFRAGQFTALDGQSVGFTDADLEELALSYDAGANPAPIVIGHPTTDAPAWGWAQSLRVDEGVLKAMIGELEPQFAQAVSEGRYKRISPSIYPRGHAASPKPDLLYLKHIGFLGGAAPAVKGLAPVAFSEEAQAGCVTVEVESPLTSGRGRGWAASNPLPLPDCPPLAPPLREGEREIALAAREAAVAAAEARIAHTSSLAFAESLIAEARLAPAAKGKVVFLLDALGSANTLSFGEGDAAQSPVDTFKSLLAAGHPVIALGEHAPPGDEFFDDADGVSLGRRAQAFADAQRAKGISISAADAVRHIKKEKM